ncbi:MAG: L-2-amino-thiazoline-4-carboxylic acid hydrolase [Bariatricus sp.]
MNTIQEIGFQNQNDFWAQMYMYVAKNIIKVCGRGGERAIRRGLRTMAEEKGRNLREAMKGAGILTNLDTLFAGDCECSADPRVRMDVLRQEEDMRIWEVYTCPNANLWLDAGEAFLGNLYCEENQHGLVRGFTGGKGQLNLTKKLTCHRTNGCRPDNYCRFSSYYRAANMDEQQMKESFSLEGEESRASELKIDQKAAEKNLHDKCIQTLYYLTEAAKEDFGAEGLNAVSMALRSLTQSAAGMLLHYADATLNKDMVLFVENNLPVSLDPDEDEAWMPFKGSEAFRLFKADFAVPLKKKLGL